jgi:predicted nucleic acid-binding protein
VPTYLDTSALLRMVENRGDLAKVDAALRGEPLTASLAELECWAAINKKWHDGEITAPQRDELLAVATTLLEAVNLMTTDDEVLTEAFAMTRLHPLRTLDGLHLASAEVANRVLLRRGNAVRFCTADRRQADAAARHFGADQVDFVPPWR